MKITSILIALVCFGCQLPDPVEDTTVIPIAAQNSIETLIVLDTDDLYKDVLTQTENGQQIIIYSINKFGHKVEVGDKVLVVNRMPGRLTCLGNPEREFDCAVVGGIYQKRMWKYYVVSDKIIVRNEAGQRILYPERN